MRSAQELRASFDREDRLAKVFPRLIGPELGRALPEPSTGCGARARDPLRARLPRSTA
jgi:hypothetical protein